METLGYGTHLIVDGFGAASTTLESAEYAFEVAGEVLASLELGSAHTTPLSHHAEGGVSVGLVLPESHLTLHTFSGARSVSLSLFSRQVLHFERVLELLQVRFEVGRLESYLGSRSVALPQDAEQALPFLIGERSYTDVRLDDTLLVF